MTDIRELEKLITPAPLTEEQICTIVLYLHDKKMIKDDDYDPARQLIEAKYAREMVKMTDNGHCVNEVIIRVNDDAQVSFRVRGLHVKCRIWSCVEEFDL